MRITSSSIRRQERSKHKQLFTSSIIFFYDQSNIAMVRVYNNVDLQKQYHTYEIDITNRDLSGAAKFKFNRGRKLGVIQPPAEFKSAAEATANAGFQNKLAVQTLSNFMYPDDSQNAFGDLLKNNQVVEFNQYSNLFKQALGDRKISYIEFINLWAQFIERLQDETNDKVLYLSPSERAEFEQNEQYNKILEYHLAEHPELVASTAKSLPTNLTQKQYNKSTQEHKQFEAATYEDLLKNKPLKELYTIRTELIRELEKFGKTVKFATQKYYNASKKDELVTDIINAHDELNPPGQSEQEIAEARVNRHQKANAVKSTGHGLKHRIRGRGLSTKSISDMKHRFEILSGEVQAGNDNPGVVSELYELIDILQQNNLIKHI